MWASLGPRPDSKCSKTEHLEPLCCGALGLMRQYCLLFISLSISPCRRTCWKTAAACGRADDPNGPTTRIVT